MARLQEKYLKEVKQRLKERFKIENDMAVPRLTKIVINMGVSGAVENKSRVDTGQKELAVITGSVRPVRLSKKAISGFKLRENMPIACMVTLRRQRMWEFARPPDQRRPPAYPRLPRREGQAGRPRQLQPGPLGADRCSPRSISTRSSSSRGCTSRS
jgi:hypothetical protein